MKYISLQIITCLLLCVACTTQPSNVETKPTRQKDTTYYSHSIVLPLYVGKLLEAPFEMGPIFNDSICQLYRFKKINLYSKIGKLKNNISEKHTYLFNQQNLPSTYYHISQITKSQPYTELFFAYNADRSLKKIDLIQFMSFTNTPPVTFAYDSIATIAKISRSAQFYDSIVFIPNKEHPVLIAQIVNQKVKTIEFIADENATPEDWQESLLLLDSTYRDISFANKSVTLLKNELPYENFSLNNEFQKLEKQRIWTYTNEQKPSNYKEYLHGSLVKNIDFVYEKNGLPKEIVLNRKKFNFYSTFY